MSLRKQKYGKSYGLVPDYFANNIQDIDYDELKRSGIKYIALDVDQTLAHHNANTLTKDIADFLNTKVTDSTIQKIFVASNSRRDLRSIATLVNADIIPASISVRKPGKKYYKKLLDAANCPPGEIAMIGDRLLTDVLGGNRAGLVTILVHPTGPDMVVDRLILRRFWGKQYLRRHRPL